MLTRHLGKQARGNHDQAQPSAPKYHPTISEPIIHEDAHTAGPSAPMPIPGAVSAAPDHDGQNRAAQAANLAAHAVDQQQEREDVVTPDQHNHQPKKSKKRVDEEEIARLVASENESRSQFTRYPGLERWILMEKMGDGAFSNVYKARDTTGEYGEVAIKVVRKYEMNNTQVRG